MIFGQSYIVKKKLGEGGFSKVYLVKDIRSKKLFALKKTVLSGLTPEHVSTLCNEFNLLKNLSCDNIIECYEIFKSRKLDIVYGVLELAQMDVRVVIEALKKESSAMDILCTLNLFYGVANGLKFLFDASIIHRDIKPDNLLLTDAQHVKISDFGLAKVLQPNEILIDFAGTPMYAAIEMYTQKGYSFEVDVWAFGCFAYEILMKRHPFEHLLKKRKEFMPMGEPEFPTIQPSMDKFNSQYEKLANLIRRCFIYDPKKRLTITECFESLELFMADYKEE